MFRQKMFQRIAAVSTVTWNDHFALQVTLQPSMKKDEALLWKASVITMCSLCTHKYCQLLFVVLIIYLFKWNIL